MKILAQRPTHISAVATVLLITKRERVCVERESVCVCVCVCVCDVCWAEGWGVIITSLLLPG